MNAGDSAERIAQSLRAVLPEDSHHRVADLAALLADAASGRLAADEVRRRLAGSPDLAALLRDLAGRHPSGAGSVVSIGDGSQLGDIQIGAVAGRDVFNLEQLVVLASLSDAAPAPKLSPSIGQYLDHLEADILQSFRQDSYVMLTVETLELDEPATADALRRTLLGERVIRVEAGLAEGGRQAPLDEAVAVHRLVALLGDPGLGKTTSLRYLALRQIQAVRAGQDARLPVWVSLGTWTDQALSASAFLWQAFGNLTAQPPVSADEFHALLEAGQLVILLDGLNELPRRTLLGQQAPASPGSEQLLAGQRVLDVRENDLLLLARSSRSRFLLTCRVAEYAHLPGWRELRILPLDDRQIEELLQHYLGPQHQRLRELLASQPGLQALARNPYLLRSLVFLARVAWHEIPNDRFALVEQCCLAALHREAPRHGVSVDAVLAGAGAAAFAAMEDGRIGSWVAAPAELDSAGQAALRCAEGAGLIIPVAHDGAQRIYRYQHQYVQEALALAHVRTMRVADQSCPEVRALVWIGRLHHYWGKLAEAHDNLALALDRCPVVGEESLRASMHQELSMLTPTRAGLLHAEAAMQLLGDAPTAEVAQCYNQIGWHHARIREWEEAARALQKALELYRSLDDSREAAREVLRGLGRLYRYRAVNRPRSALSLFAEAEATLADLGDELGIAWARYEQAEAYWVLGDLRRALERFEGCAVQLGTLGEHGWQVDCLIWQGNVLRAMGRLDVAERSYAAALQLVRQHRLLAHEYRLLVWGLAENARQQGRHRRALELYAEAAKLARRLADPAQLAQVSMRMGLVALECREDDLAAEHWRACEQLLGDEARYQLEFLERLALRWAARAPGRRGRWHTRLGRMGVSLYQSWERISAPTSFLGRLFWRLGHWTARL